MIVSIIVATDENGGIGRNNRLPWHLPSDLHRFKKITMGHHIVMGRKTYETIGIPLSGRVMVVVTRNIKFKCDYCLVVNTIESAIQLAANNNESEVFIIGGGDIFSQSINLAEKIYLTTVHTKLDADVFFPKINYAEYKLIHNENIDFYPGDEHTSDFKIFVRKKREI